MAECISCGQPVADTALICRREADRLARQLQQTADLWPDLLDQVARLTRSGDATPRAGRPAPAEPARALATDDQVAGWPAGLPVDLRASDVADVVRNTATTWARVICAEVGMDPPTETADLLRWLARRCEWIRYQPWAVEAVDELGSLSGLIWREVDRRATRLRIVVGPCPELVDGQRCTGEVVATVPDREDRPAVMRCSGCGVTWGTAQWARAGRRIMDRMREAA